MMFLEPGRCFRRLMLRLQPVVESFAKDRIGQRVRQPVTRNRLQDDPRVMSQPPEFGIELPPQGVGRMVPGPTQIEREFSQGIEPFDLRGQEIVTGMAHTGLVFHDFPPRPFVNSSFLFESVFQARHFGQTAAMPLRAAEARGEEGLDQFPGKRGTDDEAPETDHVQIVVLHALMRRERLVDQAGAMPATLFAATDAPTPLPQMAMPRAISPPATARASGTTKSG